MFGVQPVVDDMETYGEKNDANLSRSMMAYLSILLILNGIAECRHLRCLSADLEGIQRQTAHRVAHRSLPQTMWHCVACGCPLSFGFIGGSGRSGNVR